MHGKAVQRDTASLLEDIAAEVRRCERCPLYAARLHAVPGEGDASSGIVFIGEGPGAQEDKEGRPFVGAAGKFLDEMLAAIGVRRESVFITNVVKCRPPGNRDPEPDEVRTCTERYLWRQMEVIKPKLLVTLGRHAMYRFVPADKKISEVHGKLFHLTSPTSGKTFNILPQYHPAAALYNGGMRETLMRDFKKIPRILKTIQAK